MRTKKVLLDDKVVATIAAAGTEYRVVEDFRRATTVVEKRCVVGVDGVTNELCRNCRSCVVSIIHWRPQGENAFV